MKKSIYILLFLAIFSCDSENASDCFQTSGSTITETFLVNDFNTILVNRGVELVIKQGVTQQVVVQTGENLLNDVSVEVIDEQLILTDSNTCNFVRDFATTKVFVTTPNVTEIRCSTQYKITSDGVLNFETLDLVSEDFTDPDAFAVGDFDLQLDVENLRVTSNGLSFFYLSGQVENLNVNFVSGDGRFEGENLIAQNVSVFHRGSNDILVNPQETLTGTILSTGNVVAFNTPETVDVDEVFVGQLIFN